MREKVAQTDSSLCHPDNEKSCFFCCPPLRPHPYDPLERISELDAKFNFNRERYLNDRPDWSQHAGQLRPISGWECWALGYLDDERKKVGCLLHPAFHGGLDYRYRVDYGGKCSRELCHEARTFNGLGPKARSFYRGITEGMDSFYYSSRKWNPIFAMLLWGKELCGSIAEFEKFRTITRNEFVALYANFLILLSYKTDGYLIERISRTTGIAYLRTPPFVQSFGRWKEYLVRRYHCIDRRSGDSERRASGRPVHCFNVPPSFARFLKFSLDIWNASEEDVFWLQSEIDRDVDCFVTTNFRSPGNKERSGGS